MTSDNLYTSINIELDKMNFWFINQPEIPDISLHSGLCGRALLMCMNFRNSSLPEYHERINDYLDFIVNYLENDNYCGPSFASGLPGICWFINFLAKNSLIDPDIEDFLAV